MITKQQEEAILDYDVRKIASELGDESDSIVYFVDMIDFEDSGGRRYFYGMVNRKLMGDKGLPEMSKRGLIFGYAKSEVRDVVQCISTKLNEDKLDLQDMESEDIEKIVSECFSKVVKKS